MLVSFKGEVQRLQWEVARLESERNALRDEVATLSSRLELQNEDVKSLALLKTQYDALLQMYGEKLEESQELRMDLQDMKDMYKAQVRSIISPSLPYIFLLDYHFDIEWNCYRLKNF